MARDSCCCGPASVCLQLLLAASMKERELQQRTLPPNIWHYLTPVPVWELKLCRKLSSLTALTYKMHLVTVS